MFLPCRACEVAGGAVLYRIKRSMGLNPGAQTPRVLTPFVPFRVSENESQPIIHARVNRISHACAWSPLHTGRGLVSSPSSKGPQKKKYIRVYIHICIYIYIYIVRPVQPHPHVETTSTLNRLRWTVQTTLSVPWLMSINTGPFVRTWNDHPWKQS